MGGPSIDILKKVNSAGRELQPEEQQQINRVVTEYRLLTDKVKFVVIEAITSYRASK
jgi:hypothetical protein